MGVEAAGATPHMLKVPYPTGTPRPHTSMAASWRSPCHLPAFQRFKLPQGQSSRGSRLSFPTCVLHNAVLHRKLGPTDRSMVYFPCLHITGHIPFAPGANINIRFLFHNAVFTENWVPQTIRWFILPVFTSLATFPSHPGQT